jgi:hypothetical protein
MSLNEKQQEESPAMPFPFETGQDIIHRARFEVSFEAVARCLKEARAGHPEWEVSHCGLMLADALKIARDGDRIVHWSQDVGEASSRMFGSEFFLQTDDSPGEQKSGMYWEMCDQYCNIWFRKSEKYQPGYLPSALKNAQPEVEA